MFLMMLAFALVRRFSRTASIAPVFMAAVAIGFSLLIVSGVTSALGEVGFIAPRWRAGGRPCMLGNRGARAGHARRLARPDAALHA